MTFQPRTEIGVAPVVGTVIPLTTTMPVLNGSFPFARMPRPGAHTACPTCQCSVCPRCGGTGYVSTSDYMPGSSGSFNGSGTYSSQPCPLGCRGLVAWNGAQPRNPADPSDEGPTP